MAKYFYFVLIFLSSVVTSSKYHEDYMEKFEHLVENLSHNKTIVRQEEQKLHNTETEVSGSPFPCDVLAPSPTVPTSVHMLRPGDIKVVAALGDSITAALGADASTIIGLLTEYRGISWSIGGDGTYEDQETLPNILKRYNPELKGFSTGTGEDQDESRFNVAVTGSIAAELPEQAVELIDRMRSDPTIDFQNDWKVITIMTGGNDVCDVCFDQEPHSPATYIQYIEETLDILKAEVPRAFINLVETIRVQIAKDLNKGLICTIVHVVCRCAAFPDGQEGEELVIQTTDGYHTASEQLVNTGKYDTSDDFTVVVQPFLKETLLPRLPDNEPDMSFFAPDCFHLSKKGQATAANALWNNMIEREGHKRLVWSPGETIECPTEESPFFFTRKNSNLNKTSEISNVNTGIAVSGVKDLVQMEDDVKTADGNFKVTGDSKGQKVKSGTRINNRDKRRAESNIVAIARSETKQKDIPRKWKLRNVKFILRTTFVAMAVLGFLLMVLWTVQQRRKNKTVNYYILNEENKTKQKY